jgi:hypothetical protein
VERGTRAGTLPATSNTDTEPRNATAASAFPFFTLSI